MRTALVALFLFPIFLIAHPYPLFNPATLQSFKGEIASVETFSYVTRPTPHKQILLRTPGAEITVDLGPEWYLESQGIYVAPGEEVEIEGSLIKVNDTFFVIASSITQDGVTYKLREKNGLPIWRGR